MSWERGFVRSHKGGDSIPFLGNLLSGTLSRQGLLHPALFARLQVVRVPLHFQNDAFSLNLALEPTKGTLQRFALLQPNFCQLVTPKTASSQMS